MTPQNETQRAMQTIGEHMREGRRDAAKAHALALAESESSSDEALAFAGMVAARLGDPALGITALERLHHRRPQDHAVRLNLAQAVLATGDHQRVIDLCAASGGHLAAMRMSAFAYQQTGALARARDVYRSILAAQPDDPDSWANYGNVCAALGDVDAAIDAMERAITLRRDVRFFLNLANILDAAGRPDARLKVASDAVDVAPDDPAAHRALGLAAFTMQDWDQAEASLRRAIALAPTDPGAWLDLGLMFEGANRLDELDALIEQARPHLGDELALLEGWAALRASNVEAAAAAAERLPDTIHSIRRAHLRAIIADRRGRADEAFAQYTAMNAAVVAAQPARAAASSYRDTVQAQNLALAARPAEQGRDQPRLAGTPIFVTGFPRSGTTLLNTILAGLPDTIVLEEPPLLSEIENALGGALALLDADDHTLGRWRIEYRDGLDRLAPGRAERRIIDKHPLHMGRMPLLHALFPGAPVLLLERHPCDVVLSCYFANFMPSRTMLSFADLTEAARTYDAVWTAWTLAEERLTLNVHRIGYEAMVRDPAAELAPALAHIGARYDASLLDTHLASRQRPDVRTASYAQVTEPIHTGSVFRWHRYRDHLAPVLPILSPWIERLGYSTDA